MADIQMAGLKEQVQRMFSVHGASLDRFDNDCLTAIRMACGRITRQADLETRITLPDDNTDEIGLDDVYTDVLIDLIGVNLISLGQRPAKGYETKFLRADARMDDRIDDIRQDITNQAQEADTDDESSFVGLGALG